MSSLKKVKQILTHDFKLKISYRLFVLAFLLILLPNLFFLVGSYFIGVARPLINIDYLWACILFAMPYRILRWLGILVFIGSVFIDSSMMAMQLFPFLDFAAALSLAPFLINAPIRYMLLIAIIILYMITMPFFMIFITKKHFSVNHLGWLYIIVSALILFGVYHKLNEIKYVKDISNERFAQSDYFVIHSQYKRYRWVADSEFAVHFNKIPQMLPTDIPYISHHFGAVKSGVRPFVSRPLVTAQNSDTTLGDKGVTLEDNMAYLPSNKMLLIVAESWGVARSSAAQMDILANIYAKQNDFYFLDNGYFNFSGATVEGELRELCQLDVEGGYGFKKLDAQPFKNCLPHRLKKQGYQTIGMHTGFSGIYERNYLYSHTGFNKNIFAEQVNDRKHCIPFNGICDSEVFDTIGDHFAKHDKVFFYWLTLTSHSPFSPKDIQNNNRFDCDKHDIPQGDICNNFKLHAQFFDDLSKLIIKPEMRGVEVIVVGDHAPPVITKHPIHPYLQWQDVSWIHFKVKE